MNTARSFIDFFLASFRNDTDEQNAKKLSHEFFADFVWYTPVKLDLLESYLQEGRIDLFYQSLADLKYLIEFSDNLNRYWHVLRAYSEALSRLMADQSVKGATRLYSHYFEKYGDRRALRNEHWLEKKRWEFLDELHSTMKEDELSKFILKYQLILTENMKIYVSFLMALINEVQKLQTVPIGYKIKS